MLPASISESFHKLFVQVKVKTGSDLTTYNTLNCVLSVENKLGSHKLITKEFVKKEFLNNSEIVLMLYLRWAPEILESKRRTHRIQKCFSKQGARCPDLFRWAQKLAVLLVNQLRNKSYVLRDYILWRDGTEERDAAIIWFMISFSDKFQTSFKSGITTIYPLHVRLLNLFEKTRRHQSSSSEIAVPCVSASCPTDLKPKVKFKSFSNFSHALLFHSLHVNLMKWASVHFQNAHIVEFSV